MLYEIHHETLGLQARVAGEDMLRKELRRLTAELRSDLLYVVEIDRDRKRNRRPRGGEGERGRSDS